ncbi:MAG: GTP-binding protein LepA [Parcubacteria group bacterium Athens0714_26]|nr:MAG: GTP-binding protein LepA [Parcubacteria group bacterium Athens0714_26]
MNQIRNFCIIAHIDHGKSTLAMKEQYLDQLELERERGITIKMAPVRMNYRLNNEDYILNLIDTPGHSDFSYEVSRALLAVEGAILLVDASQGIQAQTLANFHAAKKAGLKIIGAVNKIDLNPSGLDEIIKNTSDLIGVCENEIFKVSGKTGEGVEELLAAVIKKVPSPSYRGEARGDFFQALVFDSFYHEHKGVVAEVRVFSGEINEGDSAVLIATGAKFKVKELGHFAPELKVDSKMANGQIGYIATGLKNPELLKIGDTVFFSRIPVADEKNFALHGYKEPQPVVFVSFYPEDADEYENLKDAAGKLKLNDSALKFESDSNEFLGRGLKAGFLGKLHFEITAERLEKEFNIRTVHSFPSVSYKVKTRRGDWVIINNPKDFPPDYLEVMEPIAKVEILTPSQYMGAVIGLREIFRLSDLNTETLGNTILITASLPLAELIRDFDDRLKSVSNGYASLSYEIADYKKTEVAKLEVLVAGHDVGGLTRIVHKDDLEREARKTVERLKELLPSQQFSQAIQAVSGGRVMARETITAIKKQLGNFGKTGGDVTRKMKLWKKQKRGKEKLSELASKSKIEIPARVFKELLKK